MTGLEKMKDRILEEAKSVADKNIAEAQAEADNIISEAKTEAEKIRDNIYKKSRAETENYKERIISSVDLQRRTEILSAKQEIIAQILDEAYGEICNMDDKEYFGILTQIMRKYILPQDGTIFFSECDLKRMPAGYADDVEKTAVEKGGHLSISDVGKDIENGFILVYGGIEENCTIKAMFDSMNDELSDLVHKIVF